MRIVVFAGLKDYFDAEFEIHDDAASILQLRNKMQKMNPAAEEILKKCRFAINNVFVSLDNPLDGISEVFVMPPSSGG